MKDQLSDYKLVRQGSEVVPNFKQNDSKLSVAGEERGYNLPLIPNFDVAFEVLRALIMKYSLLACDAV